MNTLTRRKFLATTSASLAASALPGQALVRKPRQEIIDLHQHTNYSGRNDERLLRHQRALGVNCLLYTSPSPRDGLLSRMPSSG